MCSSFEEQRVHNHNCYPLPTGPFGRECIALHWLKSLKPPLTTCASNSPLQYVCILWSVRGHTSYVQREELCLSHFGNDNTAVPQLFYHVMIIPMRPVHGAAYIDLPVRDPDLTCWATTWNHPTIGRCQSEGLHTSKLGPQRHIRVMTGMRFSTLSRFATRVAVGHAGGRMTQELR